MNRIHTEWPAAKDLCGLPGMPGTKAGVIKKGNRQGYTRRDVKVNGGKQIQYHISSLPSVTREYLMDQSVSSLPATCTLPTSPGNAIPSLYKDDLPAPATLAKWQRDTMDARHVILHYIDQLADTYGMNKSINRIVAQAKTGTLPENIQALIPVANARSGGKAGKQTLSRRTLFRWRELRTIGATALAPKEPPKKDVPAWAPYFLKCYRMPQKPSVPDAIEYLSEIGLPPGIDIPTESQCYRFLDKMSRVDREKGRHTGNDLRALLPFRRRSTRELLPLDVVTCDGHSFKSKVAHPAHGRPFQPEVCAVLDCATRKAIGWSAGLAESAETVADALRHAIKNAGIPYIFYTDPGSGNTALVNSHPAFGRYARIGITFKTGQAGRTQARGLVERFQKSCWIRAAKRLPTFKGKSMDGSTLHKMTLLLEHDIRQSGRSDRLMPWPEFLEFCQQAAINTYNSRPHSALPKITDDAGKRRHMTPNEAWDFFLSMGWAPETATETELADMFRPRLPKPATVRRGEVRLWGNTYFNNLLRHYNGEQVIVEYEPQDGHFVYVRDLEERLICRAEFEKNKDSYMPQSAIEKAKNDRADRRRKLKENQIQEIEDERRGNTVIEIHQAPEIIEARRTLELEMAAPPEPRTIPDNDRDRWRLWKRLEADQAAGQEIAPELRRFYDAWRNSATWRAFDETERDLAVHVK